MYLRFCVSESSSGCNTKSVKQANAEECKQSDNLKKRSEYDEGHRLDGPNVVERNGKLHEAKLYLRYNSQKH